MRITGSCCIRLGFACLPVVVFVSWGDVGLSPADVVPLSCRRTVRLSPLLA